MIGKDRLGVREGSVLALQPFKYSTIVTTGSKQISSDATEEEKEETHRRMHRGVGGTFVTTA